jgi:hypothetical protein
MKNAIAVLSSTAMLTFLTCMGQTVDTYQFKMNLKVPRIYNNSQSLGYRKYQPQTLKGELQFIYRDDGKIQVRVKGLYNKTHKISGRNVTYTCYEWPYDDNLIDVVAVGNNRTGKFEQGGASFAFVADPSYNIGGVDEDNTLMLELSGVGKIKNGVLKNLKGAVRGKIGCGCKAYGHKSPTRLFWAFVSSVVVDTAPLYGTFTATFKNRRVEKDEPLDD